MHKPRADRKVKTEGSLDRPPMTFDPPMRTKPPSVSLFAAPNARKSGPLDYTPGRITSAQAREAEEFCRKQREALGSLTRDEAKLSAIATRKAEIERLRL